jgi:glucose-1-phosphate cytidylyltransferase
MKVVIFCGGQGMRIREYSEKIPKPLIPIGNTPILLNIMKYYSYFGHKEFILCLGHMGDVIKDYFVNYKEYKSNNFVLKGNGGDVDLLSSDIHDWTITFVDTGVNVNIGTRLQKVKPFLKDEETFFATYGDALTDLDLNLMLDSFNKNNKTASFLACKPSQSYHIVSLKSNNDVEDISPMKTSDLWINGGFFILRKEIFDAMESGDELVEEPFKRLIRKNMLAAHPFTGFWASMDTFKDKQTLDNLYKKGEAFWEVWNK